MKNAIPVDTVKDWIIELQDIALPKRYDGQKQKLKWALNRFFLATNTYQDPTLWEKIKNRFTAIISRGKTPLTASGTKRDGQSFTVNDSAS